MIHWRRRLGWQEKLKEKLWQQGSLPLNYKYGSVSTPSLQQPTRLTPQQLEEKTAKGICYNCDSKYTKGHKCAKNKLLYIDCEEEEER